MTARSIRHTAAALAIGLLVNACGSTVASVATAPTDASMSNTTVAPPGDTTPVVPGTPGELSAPGTRTNAGTPTTGGSTAIAGPGATEVAPKEKRSGSGPVVSAPISTVGVSAREIRIGLQYRENPEGRAHQLGFSGLKFGDWKKMYGALVTWINKNGGSAGRQLVPVMHTISGNDRALQAQQACSAWTEDDKVFIGVPFGIRDALVSCLTKRGVIVVNDVEPPDAQLYANYPDQLFSPGQLSLTTAAAVTVDGLYSQGFFRGDVKIGLARLDTREHERAMTQGTVPALRRHGLNPDPPR